MYDNIYFQYYKNKDFIMEVKDITGERKYEMKNKIYEYKLKHNKDVVSDYEENKSNYIRPPGTKY